MTTHHLILGTGATPSGSNDYKRILGGIDDGGRKALNALIGLKGSIHLHLFGEWWRLLPPDRLQNIVAHWSTNAVQPVITYGSAVPKITNGAVESNPELERVTALFDQYTLRLAGALLAAEGDLVAFEGTEAEFVRNCPTINKVMEIRGEFDRLKEWRGQALEAMGRWDKVRAYLERHPDYPGFLGRDASDVVLELLEQASLSVEQVSEKVALERLLTDSFDISDLLSEKEGLEEQVLDLTRSLADAIEKSIRSKGRKATAWEAELLAQSDKVLGLHQPETKKE